MSTTELITVTNIIAGSVTSIMVALIMSRKDKPAKTQESENSASSGKPNTTRSRSVFKIALASSWFGTGLTIFSIYLLIHSMRSISDPISKSDAFGIALAVTGVALNAILTMMNYMTTNIYKALLILAETDARTVDQIGRLIGIIKAIQGIDSNTLDQDWPG